MNESSDKCQKCGQDWEQHEFGVPEPYCPVKNTEPMTTQPDIDAIAREAAIEYVSLTNTSTIEAIIAAAIRRALEPVEKHLRTALDDSCDESAVMAIAALKRENKELSAVVDAADKLESLLSRNCGSNDDWPISLKVSGDCAQELAGKLTALTMALKPYRKAKNE